MSAKKEATMNGYTVVAKRAGTSGEYVGLVAFVGHHHAVYATPRLSGKGAMSRAFEKAVSWVKEQLAKKEATSDQA